MLRNCTTKNNSNSCWCCCYFCSCISIDGRCRHAVLLIVCHTIQYHMGHCLVDGITLGHYGIPYPMVGTCVLCYMCSLFTIRMASLSTLSHLCQPIPYHYLVAKTAILAVPRAMSEHFCNIDIMDLNVCSVHTQFTEVINEISN